MCWHAQGSLLTSGVGCHCPGPAALSPAGSSEAHSLRVTAAPPGQHAHPSLSPALAMFPHSESFRTALEGEWPRQPCLERAVAASPRARPSSHLPRSPPPRPSPLPSPALALHTIPAPLPASPVPLLSALRAQLVPSPYPRQASRPYAPPASSRQGFGLMKRMISSSSSSSLWC